VKKIEGVTSISHTGMHTAIEHQKAKEPRIGLDADSNSRDISFCAAALARTPSLIQRIDLDHRLLIHISIQIVILAIACGLSFSKNAPNIMPSSTVKDICSFKMPPRIHLKQQQQIVNESNFNRLL
jgi:hypothetical protein